MQSQSWCNPAMQLFSRNLVCGSAVLVMAFAAWLGGPTQAAEHDASKNKADTILRPVPWSAVWLTVRVGEVSVSTGTTNFKLASAKGEAEVRLAKRQDNLEYQGVMARDESQKVLELLKEEKAATLREMSPRVVSGSLKPTEVRVAELGHGAVLHITPTVNSDTGVIDLKVVAPADAAGKSAEISIPLAEGQTAQLDELVWQQNGADHHVFLLVSAEALEQHPVPLSARGKLERIMKKIIFPKFSLQNASLVEALKEVEGQYFQAMYQDRSLWGSQILFAIRPAVAVSTAQISLDLHDVPMLEALRYVTELSSTAWAGEGNAVIVGMMSTEEGMEMLTATHQVPADFLNRLDPKPDHRSMMDVLTAQGISFPQGADAQWDASAGQLTVNAVPASLRRVELLVQRSFDEPVGSDAWRARFLSISKLDLQDVTLQDALKSIHQKALAVDPGKKGVKAVLASGCQANRRLTFSIENASVLEALYYAAKLTGHQVQIGKQGVILLPAAEE